MRACVLSIILFLLAFSVSSQIVDGVLDLRGFDFSAPVNISGDWVLTLPDGNSLLSPVPGRWHTDDPDVVYTLNILSNGRDNLVLAPSQVNSRYELYLNGEFLVSEDAYRFLYIPLSLQEGMNTLDFHINGTADPVGGIRSVPYLGTASQMLERHRNNILRDAFFAGCSLIMAVFFMVLYIRYKQERSSLYFSLLSLFLALRGLVTNDKLMFYFLPDSAGFLVQRIEYLAVYLLPLLFALFIKNYFDDLKHNKLLTVVILLCFVFPVTVLILPPIIFKSILFYYFGFAVVAIAIAIGLLILCVVRKVEDSLKFLISLACVFLAALYDISVVIFRNSETHILSISLIIFILYMLYNIFSNETKKLESISRITMENIQVNMYLSKFVPSEFVKTVGLGDLLTIKKGDGVEKSMTVVFTRIHNFHEKFNNQKAEDTIALLNTYYSIICPVIKAYGGFIDKFMDETTMALFPGRCDDALDAVVAIHNAVDEFNRKHPGKDKIQVCSGIHFGLQFIGIVGDEKRVDATVISKVVNTCSRIQSFTSKIGQEILVSESVCGHLQHPEKYRFLCMGKIKLKGNMDFIRIHALCRKDPHEADLHFSEVMRRILDSSLEEIEGSLTQLLHRFHDHSPTAYYLDLIARNRMLEELEK
ncbi:adenylate/guanylate cyclase domain-containing protein [Spirochaeta dissipatitropha]